MMRRILVIASTWTGTGHRSSPGARLVTLIRRVWAQPRRWAARLVADRPTTDKRGG